MFLLSLVGGASSQTIDTSDDDPSSLGTFQVSPSFDLFQSFVLPGSSEVLSVLRFTAFGTQGTGTVSIREFDDTLDTFSSALFSETFDASLTSTLNLNPRLTLDGSKTYAIYWQAAANSSYSLSVVFLPSASVYTDGALGFVSTSNGSVTTDPTSSYVFLMTFVPAGPDLASTLVGLSANARSLRQAMDRRLSGLDLATNHDCANFGPNGLCVSFDARHASSDALKEGAGVLTAAYRVTERVRVGAFVDHRFSEAEPVGLGYSGDLPTLGLFAGYGERPDGTGLQAKALGAFDKGDVTVTRSSLLRNAEAGAGKSSLDAFVLSGELGWGFALTPSIVATPYVGVRHARASRGAYREGLSASVTSPVAYDDFHDCLTVATAGIRLAGMVTEDVGYRIGAGVEQDLARKVSLYSGASDIAGMETFALATTGSAEPTRPVASAAAFYRIAEGQRLTVGVSDRRDAFDAESTLSALVGYQVSF